MVYIFRVIVSVLYFLFFLRTLYIFSLTKNSFTINAKYTTI